MNSIAKMANAGICGGKEMELDSIDGGEDGEHDGLNLLWHAWRLISCRCRRVSK